MGDWGLGIGDWGLGPIPNPHINLNKINKQYISNYLKKLILFNKLIN